MKDYQTTDEQQMLVGGDEEQDGWRPNVEKGNVPITKCSTIVCRNKGNENCCSLNNKMMKRNLSKDPPTTTLLLLPRGVSVVCPVTIHEMGEGEVG